MGVVVDLRCRLVADGKDEDVSTTRRLADDRIQLRGDLVPSPQLPRERRGRTEREDMNHADDQQVECDGYPGEHPPYALGSHLRPQRRRGKQRDQIPWSWPVRFGNSLQASQPVDPDEWDARPRGEREPSIAPAGPSNPRRKRQEQQQRRDPPVVNKLPSRIG